MLPLAWKKSQRAVCRNGEEPLVGQESGNDVFRFSRRELDATSPRSAFYFLGVRLPLALCIASFSIALIWSGVGA
ncbi:hypothetical protein Sinac_5411 [Singulisphaera acidiphila DSM 18658]|uniref:Uncharacterized protein n=1 Tax=Singulisphaera acidiphila (strain ATCC BAA-1392 / DSM 18658 / VKM B-2454 / MOB10) TaxID=886293 RepID=L0DJJ7_SINAD|nr:hypothetical protein Sinac_5411 [Singulisphaera acidiphila DSM 18658]